MKNVSFVTLKRNCKKDKTGLRKSSLAILGDCATQHLATAIEGYAYEEGFDLKVFDADYNQIDAQLMDPNSEFYESDSKFALLYTCVEKLYHSFCEASDRKGFAETIAAKIENYWRMIHSNCKAAIIQFTFVEADDRVFGNFALKEETSFLFQVKKLNYLLMMKAQEMKNVFFLDLNQISAVMGRDNTFDDKLYYIAKMPISTAALPEVAKQVMDIVKAVSGSFKKCVITDLDNTLWGGVIGDDGVEGIQIGELGTGHAFEELQLWLRELKNRGIILAVCSKNNADTAKEPFLKHPEMILKLDDFSVFVANWEDKASNIKKIQSILNIGMDSMVFLDDNPFERNQVKAMIPDITVPELPEDPAMYLNYLKSLNLFETASFASADADRTKQYQVEMKRRESMESFQNYDEYLQSLNMIAQAKAFDKFQFPRIAQLTQRSNQFNLRTVRYTEQEIADLAENDRYLTLYFTLQDQFGSHGLISVVILEKMDTDTLFVHNWLMSCRVLKRGMEEFIVNKIIETARSNGYQKVIGEYLPTPKNAMVKDLYAKMGFVPTEEGRFEVFVDQYTENKTYIKCEEA